MWTLKSWENQMPAYIQMSKASASWQLENVELCCHPLGFWPSRRCDQFNYRPALPLMTIPSQESKPLKFSVEKIIRLGIVYLRFIKLNT